jgi:hypothetical protein
MSAAMGEAPRDAGGVVAEALGHTAAGLVILEGERAASEAVYRLADAVVSRGRP